MAISDQQAVSPDGGEGCKDCQHAVVVRGTAEFVCFAYLTFCHPVQLAACTEFETRKSPIPTRQ